MNQEQLLEKIRILESENASLKEQLKKYTSPARNKKYYENHKEEIKQKNKETITSEKKKEYNQRYNLKKKEKKLISETI
jgi:phage protein D